MLFRSGRLLNGVNGRDVLLVKRFDVRSTHRAHLVSVAGVLPRRGQVFSYDAIHRVLQKHSTTIERDVERLLRLMLFNRAINNLDDHERNVSLINDGSGYRLAPVYDLVPSLIRGQYPAAGFGHQPFAPKPSAAPAMGRIFGLAKPRVAQIADEVLHAIGEWASIAASSGVSDEESVLLQSHFNP